MKLNRSFFSVLFVVAAAVGLSACNATLPQVPAPVLQKSTVDLLLEVRSKELDLELKEQMTLLKFADQSGSDYVKGFVMGKTRGSGGSAGLGGGLSQTIMQHQAQADATALQREAMAYQNSFENKAYRWVGLGLDFARFKTGIDFQKFQIDATNSQSRYTFDNLRGTQQDGYAFSANAFESGSSATLGGVRAGSAAAGVGAGAVAAAFAVDYPSTTVDQPAAAPTE